LPIPGANYKWTITIGDLTEEGFTEFAEFYDHVRDSVTNLFPQANFKVKIEAFSWQSRRDINSRMRSWDGLAYEKSLN